MKEYPIKSPMFWAPFFMFLGTAAQLTGLFFVCIIWANYYYGPSGLVKNSESKKLTQSVGLVLLGAWCLFPLFDLINSLMPVSEFIHTNTGMDQIFVIQKSQLPSSILLTSIALIVISFRPQKPIQTIENRIPYIDFYKGLLFFSILLGVYFTLQHFTGFHFKGPEYSLLAQNQLPSGNYRIFGFFGHTLHFSSVMLCLFTMNCYLLTSQISFEFVSKKKLALLTTLYFTWLLMAGGKASSAIGVLFLFLFIAKKLLVETKHSLVTILSTFAIAITVTPFIIIKVGLWERFQNFLDAFQSNEQSYEFSRLVFWKIYGRMFSDSPWIGHGAGRLRESIKEAYYKGLGLENFERKYNAHNIYLEILTNIGVIGSVLLLVLFLKFIYDLNRIFTNHDSHLKYLFYAWLVSFIANGFHGLTQNVLFDANVVNFYMIMLWTLLWQSNFLNQVKKS